MSQVQNEVEVEAVRSLEDRRYRAMVEGDVAALDALFAEELTYTHSSAARDGKGSYLQSLREGKLKYEHIEHLEERIVVSGDVAVVTGRMRASVLASGARRSINSASLAVWVNRDAAWRLLAYQSTPLPA